MRKYRLVAKKGEGTFSEVLKAQNVKDGKYHAIKCMKNRFESIDQVNNLREIQALRRLSPHEHIISLEEVLYDQPTGRLALVFELMDANLYELIKGRRHYLNPQLIKGYMWQLMKSLDHMHRKGIFHRDIKPENILIENTNDAYRGLKLADLGSCRGIYSKQPYTEYISTRWYRAPECLLTDGYYGPEMDIWGAGCVMFEITSLYPLFPGSNETDQISRIHKILGTPAQDVLNKFRSKGSSHISLDFAEIKGMGIPQLIPHAAPDAVDLIVKMLKYDASERITSREAMRHPYFKECREYESRKQLLAQQNATATNGDSSSGASAAAGSAAGTSSNGSTMKAGGGSSSQAQQQVAQGGSSQLQAQRMAQENNKGLPNIANQQQNSSESGQSASLKIQGSHQQQQLQQQQQHAQYKQSNAQMTSQQQQQGGGGASLGGSLPPIGGSSIAGSSVASSQLQQGSVGAQQSKYFTDANRVNGVRTNPVVPLHKKKKKDSARFRRPSQGVESVLKAYGVPSQKSTEELNITPGNSIYSTNNRMKK